MPKSNISREDFKEKAKAILVDIDGNKVLLAVKDFSTGSFGWNLSGKLLLKVGEEYVQVQLGINATVIGSKEA